MSSLLAILLLTPVADLSEREWVDHLLSVIPKSVSFVGTYDGRQCDIVTERLAIEVDWAPKWAEAIGQSWGYAAALSRDPCVLLLRRSESDKTHLLRAVIACRRSKTPFIIYDCQRREFCNGNGYKDLSHNGGPANGWRRD